MVIRALVVAGAIVAPVAARAQQERPSVTDSAPAQPTRSGRVHVVLPGETLWSLSQRYLGDGHRWEEIVSLNRDVVSSARRLEAGTTLAIPGERAGALPSKVANGVAAIPADGAGDDFFAPYAGRTVFYGVKQSATARAASVAEGNRTMSGASASARDTRSRGAHPSDGRSSDALSREVMGAPWIGGDDEVAGAGAVTRRLESMAIVAPRGANELHLYDRVAVRAPRALLSAVGSELLAVVATPLDGGGVAMIPVGAVRLVSAEAAAGEHVARVVAKYGRMEEGVLLVPFPQAAFPRDSALALAAASQRRQDGAERRAVDGAIRSVMDGALLPTLQHVVLVDVDGAADVRSGDAVTFYRDGGSRVERRASDVIARGTVLRASARGASVLIVQQSQPALGVGTPLRIELVAR
ncbi:MAG: LysM peptidoglycan-binding domain-containing protein [Gemmatimonadaceae bacterium]|nr:LysM peptidoglycan-binding domain-containing protein [Gemmatimonadaceae bacterium]